MVQRRFRAVHVFSALKIFIFAEVAATKGDNHARKVLDGDHQAVTELIRDAAVFFLHGKPCLDTIQGRKTVLDGVTDKAFASIGSVTDVELLAGFVGNVATREVLQRLGRKCELLFEPFAGQFVQPADHGAFFGLFAIFGRA